MGQGQPRVIIWISLVVLSYTMLHTKFKGHWSTGSGEEDFLRFLPYMGMAAMLVMWPTPFEQLFFLKGPGGCIWNLVTIRPVVSEEKSFEIVDGRTDDRACLYYNKLPRSLRLRWAKNSLTPASYPTQPPLHPPKNFFLFILDLDSEIKQKNFFCVCVCGGGGGGGGAIVSEFFSAKTLNDFFFISSPGRRGGGGGGG